MARALGGRQWAAVLVLAGLGLGGTGCMHHPRIATQPGPRPGPHIAVPPLGSVPVELKKVALPEYVIEPPDVLRIEVFIRDQKKEADYNKDLANLSDPTQPPAQKLDSKQDTVKGTSALVEIVRPIPLQPVFGEYTVRPDGTVYLGVWGSVKVAGYSLSQAAEAIRDTMSRQVYADAGGIKPESLVVVLDVTQYNSKYYYVLTDGGGAGEQALRFPIVGSETVLDAMTNIGGLSPVSSKRNIWVARRCPDPAQPDQILPVDWIGITQHGNTVTNYQVMPGDRIYVKAQRLVTVDTTLARIISPIERIFGVVLLGTATVQGFNNNNGNGFGNGFNNGF